MNQQFINEYVLLLIKQYWEKPKAKAEIELLASTWEKCYSLLTSFESAFDLDTAEGVQLDVIGKIVGLSRIVPLVIPKKFFGFSDNPNAYEFADKFNSSIVTYPFRDKFGAAYTDTELSDHDYRFFLKLKIAKNTVAAVMASDERTSIQDVIQFAFSGNAYIVDKYNMNLALYVDYSLDEDIFTYIQALDLLPKPNGVGYEVIIQYSKDNTFGFSDNLNSKGFGSGTFASKLI